MTSLEPMCHDSASDIIGVFTTTMRDVFTANSDCPPVGGGSDDIRFFAGDGAPLAAWNAHSNDDDCTHPFLWVRVMRRYRTQAFPTPAIDTWPCDLPRVIAVEVGVGRCAVVDLEPTWEDYAEEAEVSLDDSWRIEKVLCAAAQRLRAKSYTVGTDTIAPYGPEGGVIAWTGVAYIQF